MADLKNSKTAENLAHAFAGESQARNKYTYFAEVARAEGYEQIAAIFEMTANNEKEHAKLWAKELGLIGSTAENLKAAAAGADGAIDASTEIAIRYGAFLATILDFLIIAFAVFLMLKAINGFHDKLKKQETPAEKPAPPEPSNEEKLLTEIRDLLKEKK